MTSRGMLPFCPVCNKPITQGADLHEAILTRGNVQGVKTPTVRDFIYDRRNCVLVHPGKCHQIAQTRPGRVLCCRHLVQEEGKEEIIAWLEQIAQHTKLPFSRTEIYVILAET